jgi:transposase
MANVSIEDLLTRITLLEQKVLVLHQENVLLKQGNATLKQENALLRKENAALKQENADLRRRLGLDSSNSGKPPSSDGLSKPRRTQSLRKKGDPNRRRTSKGTTLKRSETPDVIEDIYPEKCTGCGQALTEALSSEIVESRQVFDIPEPKPVVTEHRLHSVACPCCGVKNKGHFPEVVRASVQYGPRIRAAATYLSIEHFIPEDRRRELLADLFGLPISTASLAAFDEDAAEALRETQERTLEILKAAPVKHMDETGFRVNGKTCWLHVISHGAWTHYRAREGRKDLLEGVSGIVSHDCLTSYFKIPGIKHALCNAHILRELKAAHELDGEKWAKSLARLLCCANLIVKNGVDPPTEIVRTLYDRIVAKALEFHEALPLFAPQKKHGKKKRRPGHNLALRLREKAEDVLRFLYNKNAPFTNNLAERDIRMMKVKQKVSGGFRTQKGAEIFCTIRGFLSSVKKQGVNPFHALQNAVS